MDYDQIYTVDFKLVADRTSPPTKRGVIFAALFRALLKPLKDLRDDLFDTYRPDVSQRTKYNSQTVVMEQILNNLAGISMAPLIYIENKTILAEMNFFYNEAEGFPAHYFANEAEIPDTPIYFFNDDEQIEEFDFIVWVPDASFADWEIRIRAEVDKYKIAGVNYDVQSYS